VIGFHLALVLLPQLGHRLLLPFLILKHLLFYQLELDLHLFFLVPDIVSFCLL
jgi:hypothetical protein